jgi:hypothetical protein
VGATRIRPDGFTFGPGTIGGVRSIAFAGATGFLSGFGAVRAAGGVCTGAGGSAFFAGGAFAGSGLLPRVSFSA